MATDKLFTRNFIFIIAANFFIAVVMYGLSTTITEYATSKGASTLIAGVVVGLFTIGALVTRLAVSGWIENFGWKKIIKTVTMIHFLTCLLYFTAGNLGILVIIRFLHGLAFGASASVIMTVGMFMVPASRYGEGASYLLVGPALSMAVGPYLSGLIVDNFSNTGGFILAAVASFLAVVSILLIDFNKMPSNTIESTSSKQAKSKNKSKFNIHSMIELKTLPISLCAFLLVISYAGLISFLRPFGSSESINTSVFFISYSIMLIVIRPLIGKIQDRKGDNVVVIPGIILQTISIVAMAIYPCEATFFIAAFGTVMGYGNLSACIQAIAVRMTSNERKPYAISTFWICCDGGMGVGPIILGAILNISNYNTMYIASAIIALFALPLYYFSFGKNASFPTVLEKNQKI